MLVCAKGSTCGVLINTSVQRENSAANGRLLALTRPVTRSARKHARLGKKAREKEAKQRNKAERIESIENACDGFALPLNETDRGRVNYIRGIIESEYLKFAAILAGAIPRTRREREDKRGKSI